MTQDSVIRTYFAVADDRRCKPTVSFDWSYVNPPVRIIQLHTPVKKVKVKLGYIIVRSKA